MSDPYYGFDRTLTGPAVRHFPITPSNDTDLAILPRAILCLASGTAVLRDEAGVDVTYSLAAGDRLDFRAVRVLATGTTATLVGWY